LCSGLVHYLDLILLSDDRFELILNGHVLNFGGLKFMNTLHGDVLLLAARLFMLLILLRQLLLMIGHFLDDEFFLVHVLVRFGLDFLFFQLQEIEVIKGIIL